ncbi:MAG: polyphosphate kinase 1 [ANME-2 cluster archaeon]|nr:polyphosphate kinase 1 [ANME-2 cluster archaeon]MBC2700840.1 polyphosphate kinase 1 [ANME-2 cluster archaeon]MBC2746000.1 polyphosphate kinase 1 [ANME-2 cluster archaeon]
MSKSDDGIEQVVATEEELRLLDDPSLFINRELSWIKLNERILEEVNDRAHPLLERIKFLAICGSGLDEFFMVRVSGLRRQALKGALKAPPDGMTPYEQLAAIRIEVKKLLKRYSKCWNEEILPDLLNAGIVIKKVEDLDKDQRNYVRDYFDNTIFPTLTPLAMDFAHPFPFISNISLNLAVIVSDLKNGEKYARIKIPTDLFPRLVEIPGRRKKPKNEIKLEKEINLVFIEDIIASEITKLFPGLKVVATCPFRMTRNAEIKITDDFASDLLTAMELGIESRRTGFPVRLEIDGSMPDKLKKLFIRNFMLTDDLVYKVNLPLSSVDFWQFLDIDRPDLKDVPFMPYTPPAFYEGRDIFSVIEKRDWVFYHPYDSFNTIVNPLKQAAEDPDVLAIKTTMYRVGKKSPVIAALLHARKKGKAVTVLVELKAKFDEEKNIGWAKVLEDAGVHVIYGLEDLKVHAKILLIVRKHSGKIVHYSLVSAGNFNAVTSTTYADIVYLTASPEIGAELAEVFNLLTGYSKKDDYKHLVVAPATLRREIIDRINREIHAHEQTGDGYIALKLNGLVDKGIIQALYRASMAGVIINLNVRGLCALRPGVKGVSENITVTSILGRFLEHSRVYYFRNGGADEVLIGSADMMPRNLNKRVEVLLIVPDPELKEIIIEYMLNIHLKDNVKARRLLSDGTYERIIPGPDDERIDSQKWLIEHRGIWHGDT